jgi:putative membrane protein
MKRLTQVVLGFGLAASIVACNNNRANDANDTAARDRGAAVGTAGASADKDWIEDQLEDGRAEIQLAQLASERATNPQVKQFAQMMVKDHQAAADDLKQAASAANVQINPAMELDNDHKDLQEDLSKLSGRDFDRKYIDAMVDEHQEAVNELEKKGDADNMQVRQWATKTLPKVRQHLDQAKQIQDTLKQAADSK